MRNYMITDYFRKIVTTKCTKRKENLKNPGENDKIIQFQKYSTLKRANRMQTGM